MTEPKTLAKSLHTLTVLVRLAGHIRAATNDRDGVWMTEAAALRQALDILGLPWGIEADPHGIIAKALAQLKA